MNSVLTNDELSVLTDAVKEYLNELRAEILDTDDFKFRQNLKQREETLRVVLQKLEQSRVTTLA